MEELLKKYSKWIDKNRTYLDVENVSDDEIVSVLKKFEDNKNNPNLKNKDIFGYDWFGLVKVLDELPKTRKEIKDKSIDVIYEDNRVKVIRPKTHQASCVYGSGTKWCTTSDNPSQFLHYNTNNNILLYVIDKSLQRENVFYKLAIVFNLTKKGIKMSLWDSKDSRVGDNSLFDMLFNSRGKDEILSYVKKEFGNITKVETENREAILGIYEQLPETISFDYTKSYLFNKLKKPKQATITKLPMEYGNGRIRYNIDNEYYNYRYVSIRLVGVDRMNITLYERESSFHNVRGLIPYEMYNGPILSINNLSKMIEDISKSYLEIGAKKTQQKYSNMNESLENIIKKVLREETGSASTGSYETPGFLAKNIPNMRQGAKTTYGGPGGKFVKIKAKCRKFPYCSQGAVDAPLELSNKYKGESSLSGEMKLTPTYPKGYKGNVHLTKTKWVNEEAIPGGKSNGMSIKDIAKKHKVSPQIAMKEWLRGIKVEMEHTTNKRIAREIAKDHLYEDIYYYKKLSKIEK